MEPFSRRSFLMALAASAVVASCGTDSSSSVDTGASPGSGADGSLPGGPTPEPQLGRVASDYERVSANVSGAALARAVAADRGLAQRLYGLVSEVEAGNFLFSPYGIATAFSMAEAGAESETEREMRTALGIEVPDAEWHEARNALDVAVRTPVEVPDGATPLELEIANSPFGQSAFSFVDDFVRTLAEHYSAELTTADFMADPDGARQLINGWVADQTGGRITDLLQEGSIDSLVRLVLVNTVFFQAQWRQEFDPAQTEPSGFTTLDGSVVEADMMSGSVRTTYAEGDGWQTVRIPYWGGYSMTVVLPAQGRFAEIAEGVADGLLDQVAATSGDFVVSLAVPKFAFATPVDLIPLFTSLGMTEAFDPDRADFSGMTTEKPLHISGAFHQATIEVDEFGTTATAATAVVASAQSLPQPAEFRADRPFIFVIEHDETSEPLFIGRVVDPTS